MCGDKLKILDHGTYQCDKCNCKYMVVIDIANHYGVSRVT
jgi:hypothetical protein